MLGPVNMRSLILCANDPDLLVTDLYITSTGNVLVIVLNKNEAGTFSDHTALTLSTTAQPSGITDVTGSVITVQLDDYVDATEINITLDYTNPGGGSGIKDSGGVELASFTNESVDNDSFYTSNLILSADPSFVTLDGSNRVETINDQSPNGNDMTSGTEEARFLIEDNWRNGQPAFDSLAADRYARRVAYTGGDITTSTIYCVCGWVTGSDRVLYDGSASDERNMMAQSFASGDVPQVFAGTILNAGSSPVAGTPCITATSYEGGTANARVEPHGAAPIVWSGSVGTHVMGGVTLGSRFSLTQFFRRNYGFLLVYEGVHDAPTKEIILAKLREKFVIQHS